jgi:hypothetical protein
MGSFWWRDVLQQVDNFIGVSTVKPGRGDSFLFWSDSWHINDSFSPLKDRFPCLFSYVLDGNLSAANVFGMSELCKLFYLPLSVRAIGEYNELQSLMQAHPLSDQNDIWVFR